MSNYDDIETDINNPAEKDPSSFNLLGKVWDNVKGFFSLQWIDFFNRGGEAADRLQKKLYSSIFNYFDKLDDPLWEDTFNFLLANKLISPTQKEFLKQFKDLPPPLNFLAWSLFVSSFMTHYMISVGGQNLEFARQQVAAVQQVELIPLEALIRAGFVAPEKMWYIKKELQKHGFSEDAQDFLFLSQYRLYDKEEIMKLWLRGALDTDKMYERMRELGFTDTRTAELAHLYEIIPGPSDLFHLVAKEAFEPDQIAKFGLDEEFPEDQVKWLEKQGVNRFWAEKYWAAHWEQPSPQQVWEMLHRGLVTAQDMDQYFRVIELPKFWRDRMTQISYSPYTRVDLRRLWKEGIITDVDEIFKEYKWQGYDDQHALNLTKFAIADAEQDDKELSTSQVLSAYERKLVNKEQAKSLLSLVGYDENRSEFILTSKDYEIEEKFTTKKINVVKEKYIKRVYDKWQAYADLNRLNLAADYISYLLEDWELDFIKQEKLPTRGDIIKWWQQKIIVNDVFVEYMIKLGYSKEHAELMLESLKKDEIEAKAQKPVKIDIDKFYEAGILSEADYKSELQNIGYSDYYIDMFIKLKSTNEEGK